MSLQQAHSTVGRAAVTQQLSMSADDVTAKDKFKLVAATPVWTLASTALALARPSAFSWASGDLVSKALVATMVLVGMNLKTQDIKSAANQPKEIGTGLVLQYTAMPIMALLASTLFNLPPNLAAGLCLTAAVPGGALANVVTYMAGSDTALSVIMTTLSTLLAVIVTPLLTKLTIGGAIVDVGLRPMLATALRLSVFPIAAGIAIASNARDVTRSVTPYTNVLASALIAVISGSIVSRNAQAITACSVPLLLSVITMHTGGFVLGYMNARLTGLSKRAARTISLQVGIRNSAMAGHLSRTSGSLSGVSGTVATLSTVIHSTIATGLAAYWRKHPVTDHIKSN